MLQKYSPAIIAFLIVSLLVSCAKEGPTGPTGPAGPSFTGSISGHVSLYDQYGSQVLARINKVRLTLTNDTVIHPDTSGYYIYNSVITGNYSIAVSDSGYGATLLNYFQFVSGALNKDIHMSALPRFSVSSVTAAENTAAQSDVLTITVPADARDRNCIVFVAGNVSVRNNNYLLDYVVPVPANSTTATLTVPAQDLYNVGFVTGSMTYYAAYSYVVNDMSVYEDLSSGKRVYNAVDSVAYIDSAVCP